MTQVSRSQVSGVMVLQECHVYRLGGVEPKPNKLHVILDFDRPELCQYLDLGHV